MIKIGVFIHNAVLYYSIKPLLDNFKGMYKIYIPYYDDQEWEKIAEHTYEFLIQKGEVVERVKKYPSKDNLLVTLSGMPYVFDFEAKYNIKFLYGIAKESWGYDVYNLNYDFIFTYGQRETEYLKAYSRPIPVGPLKFINYKFERNSIYKGDRKPRILYMPTYAEYCSIDYLGGELKKINKIFDIKIKLHHGTTFLEPDRVRIAEDIAETYNHTCDTQELFYWADIILSDVSGAIFDALYCKKRILIFQPVAPKKIDNKYISIEQELVEKKILPSFSDPKLIKKYILKNLDKDISIFAQLRDELFPVSPSQGIKNAIETIKFCLNTENIDHYKITHTILLNSYNNLIKGIEIENLKKEIENLEKRIDALNIKNHELKSKASEAEKNADIHYSKMKLLIEQNEYKFGIKYYNFFRKTKMLKLLDSMARIKNSLKHLKLKQSK